MKTVDIIEGLERCFVSPNVADSNLEPANVVDVIDRAARNMHRIAHAITPQDAAAMSTPGGGRVGSLTEAVIFATEGLKDIAAAISDLAQAVREHGDKP